MPATGKEGFIVGLSRPDSPVPAGVGFVVGERQIVTCAHVVNIALGRELRAREKPSPDKDIQVFFPMLGNAEGAPVRVCRVAAWQPPPQPELPGADVAGLLLTGEGLPAGAAPARLITPASDHDVAVELFGYPGNPARTRNGAWAEHLFRGPVGGGVIQLDARSESALRAQPGYSGSPAVLADDDGDAVIGMLAVASMAGAARDAYALPLQHLVDAWPEELTDRTVPACPYRGLAEFTRDDAEAGLFVGREAEVRKLSQLVDRNPLAVVVGPSGVGKSSLVIAGLMPALERDGWNTTLFRPGLLPFDALAKAILKVERPGQPLIRRDLTELADQLRSDGLTKVAAQLTLLSGKSTLLVVDQLEDILTTSPPEERAAFLELIIPGQAVERTAFHIVCTLRADFFRQLLDHPNLGGRLDGRLLTLSPMGPDELERVVREPAEARGVDYEPGLSTYIAREAIAGGGLPLLEFALTELWPSQQRRRITYADYHAVGGVSGTLNSYAEQVFADLAERYGEARIRALMLKLVRSRGGAVQATRRIVPKESLGEEWPLAQELAERRLTVLGTDITGHTPTVELAHEALIRAWSRYGAWVDEDADFQRWLVFIEERVAEDELLSERRAEEAQAWLARRPSDIPPEVTLLVERSNAERLKRIAEQQRNRWLAQAAVQMVWITTPAGDIAEDAPDWRSITGQTPQEFMRAGWLAAVHPEDRDRVDRQWRDCLRYGDDLNARYRLRTKTGSYRSYDVRAVPIEESGQIVRWLGVNTDVTGQRDGEELRARLTEQLSAAALRTARLQQVTAMLAEALTVEQVVDAITEVGHAAIGARRSTVAMFDPERLRLRTLGPRDTPDPLGSAGPAGDDVALNALTVMTEAVLTRRPVLIESPHELRERFELEGNPDGLSDEQAWVGLPLLAAGRNPVGALRFSFTSPRKITEDERVFMEALAGQCALALERAVLFERDHETADTLQRSLLPDRLPTVPGLALQASYRPVARNLEIGGDWYDAFLLPDGKLAVATGDVMGKGLSAAVGMGRVRTALRALALSDPRPAAVLAGLDRLVASTEPDEQLTTVVYLVLDPRTGEGEAANAGHLPPLLLSEGSAPRLDSVQAGTPLGWASPREQYRFRLPPANTMVLYSDGLVENRRRGLDVGLDELVAAAAEAPAEVLSDPARLLNYLVDRLLAGYEQDDDVTVLILRACDG
jgi:PAS domain S-box-containing protein